MTPRFFGYGSLVNLATHDFGDPRLATLTGWRRVWRHTDLRPVAFLSVERCAGAEIDGIVAEVPGADWAALDAREFGYGRRDVSDAVRHQAQPTAVAVYEVELGNLSPPTVEHPIWLSYIDVVLQGFLRQHGAQGVARFMETTEGWSAPILNDRASPHYPRHQPLDPAERAAIDAALTGVKAHIF